MEKESSSAAVPGDAGAWSQRLPQSKRPQSFPPTHRLHYPWEFRRFFGQSEVFRTSECVVFRIPNDLGHYRMGVSLKARGRAIDRNRVKRTIREFFRRNSGLLGSFDYNVVIPASRRMAFPFHRRLRAALSSELLNAIGKPVQKNR
jgi:ribonuclease P protein component